LRRRGQKEHAAAVGRRRLEDHLPYVIIDRSGCRSGDRRWRNDKLRRGQLVHRADAWDDCDGPGDHAELSMRPLEEASVVEAVTVHLGVNHTAKDDVSAVIYVDVAADHAGVDQGSAADAVVTPLLIQAMTRCARGRSCLSRLPSRATRARVSPRQAEIAARLAA
jgi:hypothetical protein